MAFLTDLDKKISMLSQGAIQKTKEVTDTAKMSSQIRTLEAQKKEALEQLGKFYYDQYSGMVHSWRARLLRSRRESRLWKNSRDSSQKACRR